MHLACIGAGRDGGVSRWWVEFLDLVQNSRRHSLHRVMACTGGRYSGYLSAHSPLQEWPGLDDGLWVKVKAVHCPGRGETPREQKRLEASHIVATRCSPYGATRPRLTSKILQDSHTRLNIHHSLLNSRYTLPTPGRV